MFKVTPIRDRGLQEQIAGLLKCPFYPDTYAYLAGELSDDASEITSLIGLCQFDFTPEKARIRSIAIAPGCETDEAIIVMVRTVMYFIYHADIPVITAESGSASDTYIKSLGFRLTDGEWTIDLEQFYRSPCKYTEELNHEDSGST